MATSPPAGDPLQLSWHSPTSRVPSWWHQLLHPHGSLPRRPADLMGKAAHGRAGSEAREMVEAVCFFRTENKGPCFVPSVNPLGTFQADACPERGSEPHTQGLFPGTSIN